MKDKAIAPMKVMVPAKTFLTLSLYSSFSGSLGQFEMVAVTPIEAQTANTQNAT